MAGQGRRRIVTVMDIPTTSTLRHALAIGAPIMSACATDAPMPRIQGEWIRIAAPPALERLAKPGVQAVDFTLFQAADGTWQLVSCIRGTAAPGGGRLLYRWESPSLAVADWTPRGIFAEADPALGHGKGSLQAPHCIRDGEVWRMFCNSAGARCLTSTDGKAFTWAVNQRGEGKFFDMARDVMLFDNRTVDGQWYAFYTDIIKGAYPKRKDNTVSYRSAKQLDGAWSDRVDIGILTPDAEIDPNYAFADAESPFVVRRGDWYYRWEQMDVYASRSLTDWKGAPRVHLVPGRRHAYLAPEIVEDQGATYMAAYGDYGRTGIFLVRIAWDR